MKWITVFTIIILFLAGCKSKNNTAKSSGTIYTCSMHPQVRVDKPGNCPICGMKLIPVVQETNTNQSNEIELSNAQIELANIQLDTINTSVLGAETVLTGTINFNEKNIENIPARVTGRIERLYFKNVGDYVPQGAKVFDLYSEELNSAKQEYVLALQKRTTLGNAVVDYDRLIAAARNKLHLWGVSEGQIREMERTGNAPLTTTFYSTAGGFITALDVVEGTYVMGGETVFRIANTSTVWAEAQVYTSQMAKISTFGSATVRLPDLGNKDVAGKIEFVNPEINPQTRINLVRVAIPNPGNQIKPGMSAYVILKGQQSNSIVLPMDAVILSENMATVWLKSGDNKFRYQLVKTGVQSNNRVQITSGLKAGDTVVVSGAYLLNSEYLLRSGGNSAMAGMKM